MWHTQVHTGRLPGQTPVFVPKRAKAAEEPKKSVGRPRVSKTANGQGKWYSGLTAAVGAWCQIGKMIGE